MITVADSNTYYYHFDGLGSVIALSDSSGDIVEQYSYDVFGEPNRISSVGNPYLFTGRRYDTETGLYYYRFRYYNPDLGRFMSADPWGIVPDGGKHNPFYPTMQYSEGIRANLYTYVANNAVNFTDPFGLKKRPRTCFEKCADKYQLDKDICKARWILTWCTDLVGHARCMVQAYADNIGCVADCHGRLY